jgi:hypothetical protein
MSLAHTIESSVARPVEVPKKIKVKITDGPDGINIACTHPVGASEAVILHLPSSKMVKRASQIASTYGTNIRDIIRRCGDIIPKDAWATAIGSEIICRLGARPTAECEMAAVAGGAYLALDNAVYRLTPVECAPVNKVMSSVRRLVIDKATIEAERIKTEGQAQANKIMELAEQRMRETTVEREKLNKERRNAFMPPQALTREGATLSFDGSSWRVHFLATIKLTHFDYEWLTAHNRDGQGTMKRIKTWAAAEHDPVTVALSVPLADPATGAYYQRAIGVDTRCPYQLPHVKWGGSCLDLGGAPPSLNSLARVHALVGAFAECMRRVQINSLYVAAPYWSLQHQKAIPEIIRTRLMSNSNLGALQGDEFPATSTRDVNLTTEAAETWTANPE